MLESGAVHTSVAVAELTKRKPNFRKDLGKMKFGIFVQLYPDMFNVQTASSGGSSKVILKS